MNPRDVAEAIAQGGRIMPSGNGWKVRCPAHEDRRASLEIGAGTTQPVVMKCHAGCDTADITAAVGLSMAELSKPQNKRPGTDEWTPAGPAVAVYDYRDEDGELLYQVTRTADKKFRQRRPDATAKSGWKWSVDESMRVLYRLPQVLAAVAELREIYVVEGEKDVHTLETQGLVATCNTGGTGCGWSDRYSETLRGAVVTIIADRDEPGRKHAQAAHDSLQGIADTVTIVQAASGKDATDHFASGRTLDEFVPVTQSAVVDVVAQLPDAAGNDEGQADYRDMAGRLDWGRFLDADLAKVDWITEPLLARGQQAALVAEGKAGKSLLCLEWACAVAAGRPFLGNPAGEPLTVLYIDMENGHDEIQRRIISLGYDRPELLERLVYLSFPDAPPLDTVDGAVWLVNLVDRHQPQLVFLDTISRLIQGKENDSDPWRDMYRLSLMPLKKRGIATVRLDHFGKDASKGARGNSAKTQDVDSVWELSAGSGNLVQLNRTHTRSGLGADSVVARRLGRPGERGTTRHVIAGSDDGGPVSFVPAEVERLAKELDKAGIPVTAGRDRINETLLRLHGKGVSNQLGSQIAKYRKSRPRCPEITCPDLSCDGSGHELSQDRSGQQLQIPTSDLSRTVLGQVGDRPVLLSSPYKGGQEAAVLGQPPNPAGFATEPDQCHLCDKPSYFKTVDGMPVCGTH